MSQSLSETSLETIQQAAARGGMYRLLARLWLSEVDHPLMQSLSQPPLRDSFSAAGGVLPAGDDESHLEQLAIDYCQLFIGPKNHLPPFQSVWQTGQLQAASTASMQNFVDVVGYDSTGLPSGMMLDHLGVQLDVMGHLLEQIAARRCDPTNEVMQLARAYCNGHLRWPAALLNAAEQHATTGFYCSVIGLTREFLESDIPF